MVSSFLTGARNRAMLTGRPVGVVLDRLQGLPQACVALSYAEVPAPYAGDTVNSNISVNAAGQVVGFSVSGGASTDVGWIGTIRVGDLVRFNYQGPYFQFIPAPNVASNQQAYDPTTGYYYQDPAQASYPWYLASLPGSTAVPPVGIYRFQIIRAGKARGRWNPTARPDGD